MGRKGFKKNRNNKKNFGKREQLPAERADWTPTLKENSKWETYYKALNIIPEEEWELFKTTCQEQLPLTFRITGSRSHASEIKQNFITNHVNSLSNIEFEGNKLSPPLSLPWYPNGLGWQLDVSKSIIRKNEEFSKTQRFLVMETEVGNISRQEAVSMIPPLLMDIKPHHQVLDMCAAPGSKTAQLVESLHAEDDIKPPTGFIMANDSDYKRSHMLVHQVKRLNSSNFIVVNHDAQLFPRIKLNDANEFLKFDRILCDVPCSGDGTMRKNITVWKDWNTGNALGLHPLQINILNRGIQLLKRGGRLVYSTCSLSPIENEAVVASVLRKWGSTIRLVNVDNELPGLIRKKGMNDWTVFGKDMKIRERSCDDLPESCFPPSEEEIKEFNLENCIRVYQHLQNTGGFFISVFEKIDPNEHLKKRDISQVDESNDASSKKLKSENGESVVSETKSSSEKEEIKEDDKEEKVKVVQQRREKLPRDANEEPFIFLDPNHEQLTKCWKFYEFKQDFPRDSTLVRNATGEPIRTIYYVAPIIKNILSENDSKLKIIHAGIKLFVSQRNDSGDCPWRIQHESLELIKNYIGGNRQLSCNLEMLSKLMNEAFPKMNYLKESRIDEKFVEQLENVSEGCVFLTIKRDNDLEDLFVPLWRGKSNVNLMLAKKDTQELLYRVFGIETSRDDEAKEQKHKEAHAEASVDKEVSAEKEDSANKDGSAEVTDVVDVKEKED